MPKTQKPSTDQGPAVTYEGGKDSLADLVTKQLPGWQIESDQLSTADALHMNEGVKAQTGATLADLERKFLGKVSDAAADVAPAASPKARSTSVRVKPDDGGPSKVADVVDGHIKIVQG